MQGRQHVGGGVDWEGMLPSTNLHPPPFPQLFCDAKRKNGNKGKSRKDFIAETIKRLPPKIKGYYFSHSRAPRIQKLFLPAKQGGRQYFPVFLGPSTLKSISLALL